MVLLSNHKGDIGLTCAVDGVSRIPYMQKPAVSQSIDRGNSLG